MTYGLTTIFRRMRLPRTVLLSVGFAFVALLLVLTSATRRPITIFMIGDSTMANKDISGGKKERGWGMALQCYFDDNIRIDNHAVNGRSSLSFINEGRWDKVLDALKPGDYVVIQFGHNDEKPKADRHTEPGSTFDYNLARFVRETREKGGIPILMNAVVRRLWTPADSTKGAADSGRNIDDEALRTTIGKQDNEQQLGETHSETKMVLTDTHGLYTVSPRDVAARMNVHFIDANAITHRLEDSLGVEGSKSLHMIFAPGEEPSVPKGRQDNTHYNVHGAHVVARLLADAMTQEVPVLAAYRTDADITVDKQGRGDYLSLSEAMQHVDHSKPTTMQILGGKWQKPLLPKKSKLKIVLRMGAQWE